MLLLLPQKELKLPASAARYCNVPLRINTDAGGLAEISLHLTDSATSEKKTLKRQIRVDNVRQLIITPVNVPEYVRSGEVIYVSFQLKNSGNIPEKLVLESNLNSLDHKGVLDLKPGETKLITGEKKTPENLTRNDFFSISLSATDAANPDHKTQAYTQVKVMATRPVENDIYYRYPVSATLGYVSMRNGSAEMGGLQAIVQGAGTLGKDSPHFIEFRVVTPNPVQLNAFTQYEEYFITYKNPALYVQAGDKSYASSYLTEYARYGRGAEMRYALKKITVGGFFMQPRFFRDIKSETNLFSTYKIKSETEVTLGYLYKVPDIRADKRAWNTLRANARLPYFKGKYQVNKNIKIAGEAAFSRTDSANGSGFMLEGQALYSKWNAGMMYLKASPHFAGFFSNTRAMNGYVMYRPLKWLTLNASSYHDARNINSDTLFTTAPFRTSYQYGAGFQYAKYGTLSFYNGFQSYEDRATKQEFNYKENFYRLWLIQKLYFFNFSAEAHFGTTNNLLSEYTGNSTIYTANVGVEKFNTSLNLHASLAHTSRYQDTRRKQMYYGARLMSRMSEKTWISLFYQNNYAPEEYYQDRSLLELLFHKEIARGHELDLSGRYALQRGFLDHKDFIVSLRYTIRINAPIQRIARYTTLSGKIANRGAQKTGGVRVMLGGKETITDKNGNFLFKNVVPGEHLLDIDRSSTGAREVTDIKMPALLKLEEKENIFNFGLTTAARIEGTVMYKDGDSQMTALLPEANNSNSIVIEASNGEQTLRKLCELGKPFDFTYLRPGEWTIKVYRNGLNKRYKIVLDYLEVTLKAGETRNIDIQVVKQPAEIRYQQGGVKVSYREKQ